MYKITFRLFELLKDLEKMQGQNISLSVISDKTGITRSALSRMMNHKTDRVYLSTVETLMAFFHTEGMPVTLGDMFSVEVNEPAQKTSPATRPAADRSA